MMMELAMVTMVMIGDWECTPALEVIIHGNSSLSIMCRRLP